jgi:hypothetical protein
MTNTIKKAKEKKAAAKVKRSVTIAKAMPAIVKQITATSASAGPHKQKKKNNKKSKSLSGLSRYEQGLMNPWMSEPIRLGWGTFVPTSIRTAFLKLSYTPISGNTLFVLNPKFYNLPSGSVMGFLGTYEQPFPANGWTGAGSTQAYSSAANYSYLTSVEQGTRIISAGIRVTARYPTSTNARGDLLGNFLPSESMVSLVAQTPNSFTALNGSMWSRSSAGGEVTSEVLYRPVDNGSFQFYPYAGTTSISYTNLAPLCCVAGIGWVSGQKYDVECIVHYETLGGLDGASDDVFGPSMAAMGITPDEAGAKASKLPSVITTSDFVETLDHALTNVRNSQRRTGMGFSGKLFGKSRAGGDSIAEGNENDHMSVPILQPSTYEKDYIKVSSSSSSK